MKKKSIVGIGIGIAVAFAILAILSSSTLAPNTGIAPSNTTTGGPSSIPIANPPISTPITPAKKSYTVELNESVGIATK
ncbi:MAG: hypothetical protein WBF38_08065 [Nitrosotalea sp.]